MKKTLKTGINLIRIHLALLAALPLLSPSAKAGWEWAGTLDIRHSHTSDDAPADETLVKEAGLEARLHTAAHVDGLLYLKYEENANGSRPELDRATVTLAPAGDPVAITLGRDYAFGRFTTLMVSDPPTLDLAEMRSNLFRLDLGHQALRAHLYLYDGDSGRPGTGKRPNHWGGGLDYLLQKEGYQLEFGLHYLRHLSDARNAPAGNIAHRTALGHEVGAWAVHAVSHAGPWSLIGEYIAADGDYAATDLAFHGHGARPGAWNLEGGYHFDWSGHSGTFAIGLGGSREAAGLGLMERHTAATLSVEVGGHAALAVEWRREEDYAAGDDFINADGAGSGTGGRRRTVTLQLALEF
jgi:hypothetical protein